MSGNPTKPKQHQFYFSAKHQAHTAPHRCFVTIDEIEQPYTEWITEGKEPLSKENFGDDLILVAEADEGGFKIRVENAPAETYLPRMEWRY